MVKQLRTVLCPLLRIGEHLHHFGHGIRPVDMFKSGGSLIEMVIFGGGDGNSHQASFSFTTEVGGKMSGSIFDVHADRLRGQRGAIISGARITAKERGGANLSEVRALPFGEPSTHQFSSAITAFVGYIEAVLAHERVKGVDFVCLPKVEQGTKDSSTLLFRGGRRVDMEKDLGLESVSASNSTIETPARSRTIYAGKHSSGWKIVSTNPTTGKFEGKIHCGGEVTKIQSVAIDPSTKSGFFAVVETTDLELVLYDGSHDTFQFGPVRGAAVPPNPAGIFCIGGKQVMIQDVEGGVSVHNSATWKQIPIEEVGIPDIGGARITKVFPDRSGRVVMVTDRNPLTGAVGIWPTELRRRAAA